MEKCEFSETQFEHYHSVQFSRTLELIDHLVFPTKVAEAKLGFDLKAVTVEKNYFIQYKVPRYVGMNSYKGRALSPNATGPFFKLKIKNTRNVNTGRLPQFNTLKQLSSDENNLVLYCAPNFYTNEDFAAHYNRITSKSSCFDVSTSIGPLSEGTHYLYYCENVPFGNIHSEPNRINKYIGPKSKIDEKTDESRLKVSNLDSRKNVFNVLQILSEIFGGNVKLINRELTIRDLLERDLSEGELYYHAQNILKGYLNLDWIISTRRDQR